MACLTRRKFLASSAASAFAGPMFARDPKPGEKLNVAVIGVNNRGAANLAGVAHENIVALCDVDEDVVGEGARAVPEGRVLHRLPQDVRQGRQGHRRGRRQHAGPHARLARVHWR